ncbi:MAG: MBL fold metallo-hydrolase, partial [Aestuariivirga sp.]|uniref:MBL fold metallo-hydrolase n=1 Tax=Aestuariivirga sp. TaxID=2650926 RepID=UPI0038D0BF77
MAKPDIHPFFDEPTNTVSYLVADPETGEAAVIDPVLDYDYKTGKANVTSANAILAMAMERGYRIRLVLETHVHADHLSGAPYIKLKTGAKVGIGERIKEVQQIFRPVFNATDVSGEGSEFDVLFKDGDRFAIGKLNGEVVATPGHTPACVSYRIEDAVFVGDTIFMPDYGTARADFPGGDPRVLYRSIKRLMALPRDSRLFMCHDYLPKGGRQHFAWETTGGEEIDRNIHVHAGVSEDEFVKMRTARAD